MAAMTPTPGWLEERFRVKPRVVTVAGAGLLFLSGILTAVLLEKQMGARAEQRAADSFSFLASNFSTMSAQIQALSAELGLVRALVDRSGPRTSGRFNPSDTSHELLSVGHDIDLLSAELSQSAGGPPDRALQLMLTAATVPGSDSVNEALVGVTFQQLEMVLRLEKVKDSLASLQRLVDAGPASRLPGGRQLTAGDAAGWAAAQVAEMRSQLDSTSAMLDRYEAWVPEAALAHRDRTARNIRWLQVAILFTWGLGTILAAIGQYFND